MRTPVIWIASGLFFLIACAFLCWTSSGAATDATKACAHTLELVQRAEAAEANTRRIEQHAAQINQRTEHMLRDLASAIDEERAARRASIEE